MGSSFALAEAAISAEFPAAAAASAAAARPATDDIYNSIAEWRRLRQGGNISFAQYAHFLLYNRDWPGESAMRTAAEKAMRPGENAASVLAFFASDKPTTGTGWMRYTEALSSSGRTAQAIAAAKEAWASPDLNSTDAGYLLARYGGNLTTEDHNRRVDALLFDKDPEDARQLLPWTSADRRTAFAARVAMQTRAPNAEAMYRAASHRISADAGLLMDRLRYLRDGGNEYAARVLASHPHNFTDRPADPDRWYEMLLILAGNAAEDRQWALAYNISRQLDDAFPPGTDMTDQAYGVRDKYTSLAWLAGRTALDRLNNPSNAVAMFVRYARGGQSLQVATKGEYWAGRAALATGNVAQANTYLQSAAGYPDLFYGQLALERLGRPVPAPSPLPPVAANSPMRTAFAQNRLVRATRALIYNGPADEQALFVRALAESLNTPTERILAAEMARQLGRKDLAVWIARAARNSGAVFYVRDSYPALASNIRLEAPWSLTHGITRQESSFDRNARSYAGARGMMQLMPSTAREQASKMGIGYDSSNLYDPNYNVMVGSAYFERMLNYWDGSVPLAVASYNAGAGNVRKWVDAYGDPRTGSVDIVSWIEAIPYSETRGYVQRVIENTVVYDSFHRQPQTRTALHVSRYLGKSSPG